MIAGSSASGARDAFESAAELRDDHIRLVALPIGQAVHATLEPAAQGLEEDGDHACRQQRDQEVHARLEERAGPTDDQRIEADDDGGERAIDQRAIDDEVNVVEAILQDGEPSSEREKGERDGGE